MSDEILKAVSEDATKIREKMVDAEKLIQFLKDSGEETAQAESELRSLKIKSEKYEKALKDRGYDVK